MVEEYEKEIFKEIDAFTEAWNSGDASARSDLHTEDPARVSAAGDVLTVRMLYPSFAIWQGPLAITPVSGSPLKGSAVQLMLKVSQKGKCCMGLFVRSEVAVWSMYQQITMKHSFYHGYSTVSVY